MITSWEELGRWQVMMTGILGCVGMPNICVTERSRKRVSLLVGVTADLSYARELSKLVRGLMDPRWKILSLKSKVVRDEHGRRQTLARVTLQLRGRKPLAVRAMEQGLARLEDGKLAGHRTLG